MTLPVITVERLGDDRLAIGLAQLEPGDRRGVMPAVEALMRRVGIPQDLGHEADEVHVLLVELAPDVAVADLVRRGDEIGIDVREIGRR